MPTNDKMIYVGRGKSVSRWSYRLGEVESIRDGGFLVRVYCCFAETVEDAEKKEATEIMAVIRGNTEDECFKRGNKFFNLACAGEFE